MHYLMRNERYREGGKKKETPKSLTRYDLERRRGAAFHRATRSFRRAVISDVETLDAPLEEHGKFINFCPSIHVSPDISRDLAFIFQTFFHLGER